VTVTSGVGIPRGLCLWVREPTCRASCASACGCGFWLCRAVSGLGCARAPARLIRIRARESVGVARLGCNLYMNSRIPFSVTKDHDVR
jgi:hypothetical protein